MVMLIGFHTIHNYTTDELKHTVTFLKKTMLRLMAYYYQGEFSVIKMIEVQLLPTHMTKRGIWNDYIHTNGQSSRHIARYMSFINIWKKFAPHIIITKPTSVICWVCQRNSVAINRAAN